MIHSVLLCLLFLAAHARAVVDADGDGLIDIDNLIKLDAIRHNLQGTGLMLSASASSDSSGCPNGTCRGYELTADLNFDTNNDNSIDQADAYWRDGQGWQAIGTESAPFTAIFDGNGHVIQNLHIKQPAASQLGLFGVTQNAKIRHVGLAGQAANVVGLNNVGSLIGLAKQTDITGAFSTVSITGDSHVGGLIGRADESVVTAVYATGNVLGDYRVGGLIGRLAQSEVVATFATGRMANQNPATGGLIGYQIGSVISLSYWAVDSTSQTESNGGTATTIDKLKCVPGSLLARCAGAPDLQNWPIFAGPNNMSYWQFGDDDQLPYLSVYPLQWRDGDGDGVPNLSDKWPKDGRRAIDADGDGFARQFTAQCDDTCARSSGLVIDAFDNHAAVSLDNDLDGMPDAWNEACDASCQAQSGLMLDAYPNDGDNDGIPDTEDTDDNGDGIADADSDSNGLLEIDSLQKLNAIRFNLAGHGFKSSENSAADSSGCPTVQTALGLRAQCHGYELVAHLNFDSNDDQAINEADSYWEDGLGWRAIGSEATPFTGDFNGNGYAIQNLYLNRPEENFQGLFGHIENASISNLALTGPLSAVTGNYYVGSLAAQVTQSVITASYSTVAVTAVNEFVGGLVGRAENANISNTYSKGPVSGRIKVGGLVGDALASTFTNNFSIGFVNGRENKGGLIGYQEESQITHNYWAIDTSDQPGSAGGAGVNLDELKCATSANNTNCAAITLFDSWDQATDADGTAYWQFGANNTLPSLRLFDNSLFDGDGDAVPDSVDVWPLDPNIASDKDGDGVADAFTQLCLDKCSQRAGITLDAWPEIFAASVDSDADGLPDEWHPDCDSACQTASALTRDPFPYDRDNDGISDVVDRDDNNDGRTDVDADSDGLIDVATLEELNAIRFALNGHGQRLTASGTLDNSGCPTVSTKAGVVARCRGYELVADINFDSNDDGQINAQDRYWNDGAAWDSIGDFENPFTAIFEGNGHVVQNLVIVRTEIFHQGLFGYAVGAEINRVGLTGPLMSIAGYYFVGGIVGQADRTHIEACYMIGRLSGDEDFVGGIIGEATDSSITASFVQSPIQAGGDYVGGLIGRQTRSRVIASYAAGKVQGRESLGAMIGSGVTADIQSSHWAVDAADANASDASALLTEALRCPTTADNVTCTMETLFDGWQAPVGPDGQSYWDFGNSDQLPVLKINGVIYRDSDNDGVIDSQDKFASNRAAAVDDDDDGLPDAWLSTCDLSCQTNSGLTLDGSVSQSEPAEGGAVPWWLLLCFAPLYLQTPTRKQYCTSIHIYSMIRSSPSGGYIMSIEIVYRVIKRDGSQAGEYMDKKLADAHDQRLDCVYTIVDLIEEKEDSLSTAAVESIAEHLIDHRQELVAALKKVKDIKPAEAEKTDNVEPIQKAAS